MRQCLLIGNSRWHWATKKKEKWHYSHSDPNPLSIPDDQLPWIKWAAVGPIPSNLSLNPANRINANDVPLKNLPPWLGVDRALAGWAAFLYAKESNTNFPGLIVADAGTVLSITRITTTGDFSGGQLVAGLRLQLEAMATGTQNLCNPGLAISTIEQFPFKTSEAMQRGALQALIGNLIQIVKESNMELWLCGGDSQLLLKELQKQNISTIYKPNLVLEGMVRLYSQITLNQDP